MLKEVGKTAIVIATSTVAVPYTVALVSNVLCGWPLGPDKYKRAFHPKKVYALNYAILQQLTNLRFVRLWVKWKRFYAEASPYRLIKVSTFNFIVKTSFYTVVCEALIGIPKINYILSDRFGKVP